MELMSKALVVEAGGRMCKPRQMKSENKRQFWTEWARFYAGLWPAGWMLRTSGQLPWTRFHALPESKRYADTPDEYQIVLERAYELADQVLQEGAPCWLVTATYEDGEIGALDSDSFFADEDGDEGWLFSATEVTWERGSVDAILAEIAQDRAGPTLWFSRETGKIFAPYDGGFDIFLRSPEEVEEMKTKYGEWRSSHPEGL